MAEFKLQSGMKYFPEEIYDSRRNGEWHLSFINAHEVSVIYWNFDGSYDRHCLFSTKEQAYAYIRNEENGLLRQLN